MLNTAYTPNAVRLSDDRLVWIGVTGVSSADGTFQTARFYWSPWAGSAQGLTPTAGPVIPAVAGLASLAVGGDYAAALGCDSSLVGDPVCHVYVVRLSTRQLWTIPGRPGGNQFVQVLAASPTELVLAEIDSPVTKAVMRQEIQRIVRVQISALDQLGW